MIALVSLAGQGHRMADDAHTVYLFQCAGDSLFAVSHDVTGANLPRATCSDGWLPCKSFVLGELPAPAPIGYYMWRDPCWSQRRRTAALKPW
jgi:hypothetical protein